MPVLTDLTTQLEADIDALVDADVALLSDAASIEALSRQFDRLEAVRSRATARFDADRGYESDGAFSAAAWLATRVHLPTRSAHRRVRLGRALRHMDLAEKAWLAGEVGSAQIAALEAFSQRRADALVEMARRSAAMPEGARMPEPLFTVLVGYETLKGRICELADGTVVSPGSLVRWLDQAWIERIVFESPSRVMDVGVKRRIFAGATRRAEVTPASGPASMGVLAG